MNRQEERRKDYESPRTRMVQVETEGNLCGSVDPTVKTPGSANTEKQQVNQEFGGANDFSTSGTWD